MYIYSECVNIKKKIMNPWTKTKKKLVIFSIYELFVWFDWWFRLVKCLSKHVSVYVCFSRLLVDYGVNDFCFPLSTLSKNFSYSTSLCVIIIMFHYHLFL